MSQDTGKRKGKFSGVNYVADMTADVISFEEIQAELGYAGERLKAEELIGKTFIIQRAKPFRSSYAGQEVAYFCVIKLDDREEEVTAVLGGQVVAAFIEEIHSMGVLNPVRVTLLQSEARGDKSGYYYFS